MLGRGELSERRLVAVSATKCKEQLCTRPPPFPIYICQHPRTGHHSLRYVLFAGDPYGTRTHVTTVKGWCLNRLTNGPYGVRFSAQL